MADTHPSTNGATTTSPHETSEQWGALRPVTLDANGVLKTPHGDVKPNFGASLPDTEDRGADSEPLRSWQKRNNIDTSAQVKLVKLVHMRYQHPDLEEITTFLRDFGMHIAKRSEDGNQLWFRGYGPDQYVYYAQKGPKKFLGGTYSVESMAELEKAAKIEGAGQIEELKDAPGGGHLLTLTDPEGFLVNLMYGQQPAPTDNYPQKVLINDETDKPRVRKFNRYTPGPAAVHKLGHYGLCVTDFATLLQWYTRNFNLAPTDFLWVPQEGTDRKDVAVFAHIDRGDDPVDHHTFFMSTNPTSHVHHCSFEVHDYDTQHLGHQWLGSKGYTSVWGIGRHILGSQIFDYWWDTTGNMVEHYTDGDLVNQHTPIGWSDAKDEALAVWGPEVPKWFLE
ncbi:hypothetical protein BAUCODRAFT_381516 [Baudoinia panamericana UAMH 10762]|uniref:VOC domain-containing protein n=1 Tax=Baudoinia panamericana (strain UAMH 10762) TaxID=717646 RepID=M2NHJ5_BAUPA|nr:uncharacterized protein BAUCODRAFT_381516 [Baudoinia panamericana UAMH 10762]EMC98824.1 hypothetical protein BAUCODRAFT_381516 [Baudoinia panamericana UAMH 10762]